MSGIAMAVVGGALLYLTIMTLMNATNLRGISRWLIEMLTTLPESSLRLAWVAQPA